MKSMDSAQTNGQMDETTRLNISILKNGRTNLQYKQNKLFIIINSLDYKILLIYINIQDMFYKELNLNDRILNFNYKLLINYKKI